MWKALDLLFILVKIRSWPEKHFDLLFRRFGAVPFLSKVEETQYTRIEQDGKSLFST